MTELNNAPSPEPLRRFGASARALQQRRWILLALKGLILACVLILALKFQPPSLLFNLFKWVLVAGLTWGLWQARGEAVLRPLQERELTLHANALELRRGSFRRFVVFESLRHIRAVQSPRGERFLSLRLDTEDDSLLLRDMDGLPEAFAAIAGAKPDRTMIEIDEQRVDWGEPLPWALAAGATALLLGLILVSALSLPALKSVSGRLMVLNGLGLGLWRPLGRDQHWHVMSSEIVTLLILLGLGYALV